MKGIRVNDYHGQSHHGKDPEVTKELVAIEREHMALFADFLQQLRGTTNGGLRHGQHIACPEGTPLTNLFVTMMQRLGIDEDSFARSTDNLNNEIA